MSNLTTRVTALESGMADLAAGQAAILDTLTALSASLSPASPAKVTRTKPAAQPKAAPKATKATRALTKATRKAFIAAAAKEGVDLAHFSTKEIAANGFAPKGFHIGERYTALVADWA